MFLSAGVAHAQSVLYVDDDASVGGDGTSWATAFNDLQDALAASPCGEIWVPAGVCKSPKEDRCPQHLVLPCQRCDDLWGLFRQ